MNSGARVSREGRLSDGTYCDVVGQGYPLLLLHGVGLNRTTWRAQVVALSRHFTVVTYDHLGHGRSRHVSDTQLDDYVQQFIRVMDQLGMTSAHVVGFSFGGLVAQRLAADHPDRLNRLVLMSTVYNRTEQEREAVTGRYHKAVEEGPQSIIPAAIERWFSPAFIAGQPEVIGEIERGLRTNDPASFLAAYRIFCTESELAGKLRQVEAPTLAMTGELDTGSTPAMVERMVADLPNGRGLIIPEGRHMMPMELAGEVNAALLAFLMDKQE
jgi:pimeloyl-ACP methyl ester carboxylesterase